MLTHPFHLSRCFNVLHIFFRISELKQEYKEEEITQKGYVKKLRCLVSSHLMDSQQKNISQLEEELGEEEITEVRKGPTGDW